MTKRLRPVDWVAGNYDPIKSYRDFMRDTGTENPDYWIGPDVDPTVRMRRISDLQETLAVAPFMEGYYIDEEGDLRRARGHRPYNELNRPTREELYRGMRRGGLRPPDPPAAPVVQQLPPPPADMVNPFDIQYGDVQEAVLPPIQYGNGAVPNLQDMVNGQDDQDVNMMSIGVIPPMFVPGNAPVLPVPVSKFF